MQATMRHQNKAVGDDDTPDDGNQSVVDDADELRWRVRDSKRRGGENCRTCQRGILAPPRPLRLDGCELANVHLERLPLANAPNRLWVDAGGGFDTVGNFLGEIANEEIWRGPCVRL